MGGAAGAGAHRPSGSGGSADVSSRGRSYVVECYSPSVRRVDVETAAARAAEVSEHLNSDGSSIEYGGAILVPDDEVVLHLFTSDSEDAVREASTQAALPFERIVEMVEIAAPATSGEAHGPKGER